MNFPGVACAKLYYYYYIIIIYILLILYWYVNISLIAYCRIDMLMLLILHYCVEILMYYFATVFLCYYLLLTCGRFPALGVLYGPFQLKLFHDLIIFKCHIIYFKHDKFYFKYSVSIPNIEGMHPRPIQPRN